MSPSPGECVIALKSMIGSTAQQFLTYLSHRGEETGNIRGSMRVRVPAERLGTRERLYGEDMPPWCPAGTSVANLEGSRSYWDQYGQPGGSH